MKTKSIPNITSKSYRMTFGKHKGYTIEYILDTDPGYIIWLDEEKICTFSDEIYREAQEMDYVEDFTGESIWDYMADD